MKSSVWLKTALMLLWVPMVVCSTKAQEIKGVSCFLKAGYISSPGSALVFDQIDNLEITDYYDHFLATGIEGNYRKDRALFGLEAHSGIQTTHIKGSAWAQPHLAGVHARIGWIVAGSHRYWIYPTVAGGMAYRTLTTYTKTASGIMEDNYTRKLFTSSIDIGLNADYIIRYVRVEDQFGGVMAGLRIGYRTSLHNNYWKDKDGNLLDNISPMTNRAFYVTLNIGLGWFLEN